MKRHSLNTACGLLSLVGTVSLLSGTFSSAWADTACTNASFSGSYAFSEQGTGVAPDGTPFSVAEIGILKADGKGNLTGTATASYGGTIVKPELTGTYTINPDCSGQAQVINSLTGQTIPFAIVIAGPEFRLLATFPGSSSFGTGIRQTSPCKWCKWW